MKRSMSAVVNLIFVSALLISACGQAKPPQMTTELTFWYPYPAGSVDEQALKAVLVQASIDLPQYKISALPIPLADIYKAFTSQVAVGGGPDMFLAPNDNLGSEASNYQIANITNLVKGKLDDYAPLSVESMSTGNEIYGIPESLNAVVLWYNKTDLSEPPKTTDELKNLMAGGTPIGISFSCDLYWGFFSAFGGKVFDKNNNFVTDQGSGMVDAMAYLNNLYQLAKKNNWPRSDTDSLVPFTEGQIIAVSNGSWAMNDYKNALGDKLGVVSLPPGPKGPALPLLGVDGYYFNPNSQKQQAAIDVALYLTGKSAEKILMDQAGHVPAIATATVTDPLIKNLQDAFKNSMVRPQNATLDKYWANFCNPDQIFEKGVKPAAWVEAATAAARK